jgi:hypothetical protein
MSDRLPRVLGLKELLALKKQLRERPAPLVYFTDAEFKRSIKGAIQLKRRPINPPLAAFDPWSGGGFVQSSCQSPPGQICFGQWTPAAAGRPAGSYFDCKCKGVLGGPKEPLPRPCQLMLAPSGTFQCTGECPSLLQRCRLGYWRNPASGRYVLDCRCAPIRLQVRSMHA